MAPLVVVLAATTIVPFLYTLGLSLSPKGGGLTPAPTGAGNYVDVFQDGAVWHALGLAITFLVGALGIEVILGVGTALILERFLPNSSLLRVLFLWPAVLPPIAVALVFDYILQGDVGMVSYYLGQIGIHQAWLTKPGSALAVIIIIDAWQFTSFVILLTLAALKTVPEEVEEAAQLDGAGAIRTSWSLILPIIRPALISIVLLRFIDAMQVFPTIFVLTRGGPGSSTQLITYYSYTVFFRELRFSQGAALAIIVVIFTILCVLVFMLWQRQAERR